MDSSAPTCNDFHCWDIGAKVGVIFGIFVVSIGILLVLWDGIWRPLICGYSRRRARDIESGRVKKRSRIAAFFLGADPPPRKHRRRLQKKANQSPTTSPTNEENGLLENAAWEALGRVAMWVIGSQEALSQAARRGHQRDPSTLPPPRPVEKHHGRRISPQQESGSVGSDSLTSLHSNVSSSLQPSMAISHSDSVPGSSLTRRRSTSASRCASHVPPPARRSSSHPPMARNPHSPPGVPSHDFATRAIPRANRTRTRTPLSQVTLAYTPIGPTSSLPRYATVRGYGRQGRGETSAVMELPRSHQKEATPRSSY